MSLPSKEYTPLDIAQDNFTYQFIADRGITAETYRKYNARTKVLSTGQPYERAYSYKASVKFRGLREKKFRSEGPINEAGLYAKDIFPAGSARGITVTEGEEDAHAVYQMSGGKSPAVSVQSSSTAYRDCLLDREYLNSFERIYLCFDNDTEGQKAAQAVAPLFDRHKLFIMKLAPRKDANEYLIKGESDVFNKMWWNTKANVPDGILSNYDDIDKVLDAEDERVGYPLPAFLSKLQEMTDGVRTSEYWLWTAREGTGKTEILRAVEYAALAGTGLDTTVATIHLEERKDRQIRGMAGLWLGYPCHLKSRPVDKGIIKEAYREATRRDGRLHIYSHVGSDDVDSMLDIIRYLVVGLGCKYVFLDSISLAVAGKNIEDERKAFDSLATGLARLVNELDFHLSVVSHVNKEGETRGSTQISKVAHVWVHLERPIEHEIEIVRNTTTLTVRKNRPTGMSGPAGQILYHPDTGTYRAAGGPVELPV